MSRCEQCWIPLIEEGDETPSTVRQIRTSGGLCLQCELMANDLTFWQHGESDCVFLGPPEDTIDDAVQQFYYECDCIPIDLFFARIAEGYSVEMDKLLGHTHAW